METIHGKQTRMLEATRLAAQLRPYRSVLIDLGTGDGRYVRSVAQASPERFVIGLDACRENLRSVSRSAPSNALFVIANALDLPWELRGLAGHITINFPWGSLLGALVEGDPHIRLQHGSARRPRHGSPTRLPDNLGQAARLRAGPACALPAGICLRATAKPEQEIQRMAW